MRGKNISQVLQMSVVEACDFFTTGNARTILGRPHDVGLGYLGLGQPLTTLSGGERQRLELAISMATKGSVYVLDEPITGLHLADVDHLLAFGRQRQHGGGHRTSSGGDGPRRPPHRPGPGAGHHGGRVVFQGSPAQLVEQGQALTARHLRSYLER